MRTEDDKIVQAGIAVTLGGNEYVITPLVIRYSREWHKAFGLQGALAIVAGMDNPERAITMLMVNDTDRVMDCFFGYARDLDRATIEAMATEGEIVKAFVAIVEVAFPSQAEPAEGAKLTIGGALEFLMSEWHIAPDYIVNHWTDELLDLMIEKLAERKEREAQAVQSHGDPGGHKVSASELFADAGPGLIKIIKGE